MTTVPLGPGREFDAIRAILAAVGRHAAGVGDDAAVIPPDPRTLVLSTDLSVEGVHFRRDWLSLEEVGWRAASAALSDLAAMGATPVGILVSLGVPSGDGPAAVVEVMRGAGSAVAAVGGAILGGDLTTAPCLLLDVTVVGRCARPVTRAGARPGDALWVSGALGGAAAAVAAWEAGEEPSLPARVAFAHPLPRCALGEWLGEAGATAMLDLSDGLAGDAAHLAAASGVGLDVDLGRLPLHPGAVARWGDGAAGRRAAARGGEDYELLVTMPPGWAPAAGAREVPLTRIGRVTADGGVRLHLEGRDLTVGGFDHFA